MEYENDYNFCKPYLATGEYVLWRGKPGKGKLLNSSDIFMIPFSLYWCGFAFFWEWNVIQNGIDLFTLPFTIFGIPMVCLGLYMVIGRFFHKAWLRKRTNYVITNMKIIRKRNKKVDVLMGANMPQFTMTAYRNGNGSIYFGNKGFQMKFIGYSSFVDKNRFSIENVPEVIRVQQILTQISKQ